MQYIKEQKIKIDDKMQGVRLDIFLKNWYTNKRFNLSRTYFQKLIKEKNVLVNKHFATSNYILCKGDVVEVNLKKIERLTKIEPENIPLDIIYEDEDIIIINKPAGMVVHPACGNIGGTLVNALMYHFKNLPVTKDKRDTLSWLRPGLVHRLDKDTSGVIVIAKTEDSLSFLAKQFSERKVIKKYLAIVSGRLTSSKGTIDAPIGRHPLNRKKMAIVSTPYTRKAVTLFSVLEKLADNLMLMELIPKTGRTHQIRVHLNYIGCKILGDSEYGISPDKVMIPNAKEIIKRVMLHALSIEFTHPRTHRRVTYTADIPKDFRDVLDICRK